MTLEMLAAYYSNGHDNKDIFEQCKIGRDDNFYKHMNQYNVIVLNMQEFLSNSKCIDEMIFMIQEKVKKDIKKKYLYLNDIEDTTLVDSMYQIFEDTNQGFVILIDEWDCIFREYKDKREEQKNYLNFLRDWLKDKLYVELAYMTGILPIKKYGSHSALNMFTEYSMTNPRQFTEFVGFTEEEVRNLCERYEMNFEETKAWYDGYSFPLAHSVYSPESVVECMLSKTFDNYWNQTETFEALKIYIQMNYEGLKDKVIEMIAGSRVKINTGSFTNDMTTFHTADDVLTLLIHLAYHFDTKEVYIPNKEVANEFFNAVKGAITQIKNKNYVGALTEYQSNLILVGINYDKTTKVHSCKLEKFTQS